MKCTIPYIVNYARDCALWQGQRDSSKQRQDDHKQCREEDKARILQKLLQSQQQLLSTSHPHLYQHVRVKYLQPIGHP